MPNKQNTNINYALVESKRPPLYTCMKYWGKKPHNIWNEYIKTYTSDNEYFLDPFTGSAMSAFESFKAGKKTIALDLNPLSSFIIEVVCSNFDFELFQKEAKRIINEVSNSYEYKTMFCYKRDFIVHNVKWNNDEIYEVCIVSNNGKDRSCLTPSNEDYVAVEYSKSLNNTYDYPKKEFRDASAFTMSFLKNIGKSYNKLWTDRNLYILSIIFYKIKLVKNESLKKQLLFAFIQTVHLCCKMCVPRSKKTNRDFSTSWGRSAYLFSKKQMEMNPLLLFESNCFDKQSVSKCLLFAKKYFKKIPIIRDINEYPFNEDEPVDIWYGVCDIKTLKNKLPEKSIGFILTDPPYGGLIQYLDLSNIWLSWLELYDKKYKPNFDEEITVNSSSSYEDFEKDFTSALCNLNYVLKDDAKLVLTFHNKDLKIWTSFLRAIETSGFRIEKVIHQQNKRTGESNVTDPFGTSASDFYIRCIKSNNKYLVEMSKDDIEKIIIEEVKTIILERYEPTPYQILFNGLLAKLSMLNIDIKNFDSTLLTCLKKFTGKEFIVHENLKNKAGNYWWISNLEFNENASKRLSNRVRNVLKDIFDINEKISHEKILKVIFKKFPNGQTPDVATLEELIKEFAIRNGEFWCRR